MRPITKHSLSIIDPDTIPTILRDAFKIAERDRPGVVHIELPEDVASENSDVPLQKRSTYHRPLPDTNAIDKAAGMINNAKNPMIIVSGGANRNLLSKEILDFIHSTGIYVVHTQMGKGIVPHDCAYSLFTTGIHGQDYVNCGIDQSDTIITIGYNIVEYPPYIWNKHLNKKIINIDFSPSNPDRYYNPDIEVIGDIKETLKQLGKKIEKRDYPIMKKTKELVNKKLTEQVESKIPMLPQEIVRNVREVMDKDDIITLDNGIYKLWFSRLYETYKPNTILLDNALATMGAGLPTAISAKMVHPNKKVLAVVGDGGFMMNSQEIETALREKIPVVVLILNDNAFGFIKWKQKDQELKEYGLDYTNPDFVKYAESYGAKGFKVTEPGTLVKTLKQAFDTKQVCIVECPIDYSQNYKVFSEELRNLVCSRIM